MVSGSDAARIEEQARAQEALERWMRAMVDTHSVEDGVLWPHLEDGERQRRLDIVMSRYPELEPSLVLVTRGWEAAETLVAGEASAISVRAVVSAYEDFVSGAVFSTADNYFTSDGLNYRWIVNAWGEFQEKCREAADHDLRPSPREVLLNQVSLSLDGSLLWRLCRSPEGGPPSSVGDSWATQSDVLERMSQYPGEERVAAVLGNPMTPQDVLAAGLHIFPYPQQFWSSVDEDEVGLALLGGNYAEDDEVQRLIDVSIGWRKILIRNRMLPEQTVHGVLTSLGFAFTEYPTRAAALLHPAMPGHALAAAFLEGSAVYGLDWTAACIGVNPATPADVLAQYPTLDRSRSVNFLDLMDITVDQVIVAAAINPSTPGSSRVQLSALDSEDVAFALKATAR